jgi:hypothetical protein
LTNIWQRSRGKGISSLEEGKSSLPTVFSIANQYRQASYDAPTESELLELAAEDDGTVLGEQKAEQKRVKEENWAVYTEANKKGAGNTMNRG